MKAGYSEGRNNHMLAVLAGVHNQALNKFRHLTGRDFIQISAPRQVLGSNRKEHV